MCGNTTTQGELPFFQGEQSPFCLYAKHSGGATHTQHYLLFKENLAKHQQPTLLASTSFCPEGCDSLKNKYLGLDTAEQAAKILAARG